MIQEKVSKELWPKAVEASIFILNLTPSNTLGGISPYQALARYFDWDLEIPYVGNIRIYRCKAFAHD